jgi:Glutamate/Leucine/Phenylalanine/Valine dehydrogenase
LECATLRSSSRRYRNHAIAGASGSRHRSADTAAFVENQHSRAALLLARLNREQRRRRATYGPRRSQPQVRPSLVSALCRRAGVGSELCVLSSSVTSVTGSRPSWSSTTTSSCLGGGNADAARCRCSGSRLSCTRDDVEVRRLPLAVRGRQGWPALRRGRPRGAARRVHTHARAVPRHLPDRPRHGDVSGRFPRRNEDPVPLWAQSHEGLGMDDLATGHGVKAAAEAALAHLGRTLEGATVAVEGFGRVGARTARACARAGARVLRG